MQTDRANHLAKYDSYNPATITAVVPTCKRPHMSEAIPMASERIVAPFWRFVVKRANAITPLTVGTGGTRFYCVHPIAGDVTSFYDLAGRLGPEQAFYGVQVPIEKMNADFGCSIPAMASFYVNAIATFQPSGQIVLGGWSAGAIIALEMAQQLRAMGRDVPLLVAFDGAPCNTGAGLPRWHPRFAIGLFLNAPLWFWHELQEDFSMLGFLRRLSVKVSFHSRRTWPSLRNSQTLQASSVREVLASKAWSSNQIAFIQSLYRAMRLYVPKPYGGDVLIFESRVQPLFHLRHIGLTWKKIAARTETVTLNGNHMGIFREPTVRLLGNHLRQRLARV